jgi:Rps23 Pro-64 3,4-dihydroxylase Tpa1-like proline 4-hydroxylase
MNNSLKERGFYVGDLSEIVRESDMPEFDTMSALVKALPLQDNTAYFHCCILGSHNDPEWPMTIPITMIESHKEKIKEHSKRVTQQWTQYATNRLDPVRDYFRKIVKGFIRDHYPEINPNFSNLEFRDSFSFYQNGDFIDQHRDGQNPGRIAAVLIYMSDPCEYDNGGGELVVQGDDQTARDHAIVSPVKGNYVVLDFKEHNPFHTVNRVTGNFKRYCYLGFLYNTEEIKDH